MRFTAPWWSKRKNDPPPPPPPFATDITSTTATIGWADMGTYVTAYRIQMAPGVDDPFVIIYEGLNFTFNVTGLTPGASYRLRRRTIVGDRESDFSVVSTFQAKQSTNPPPITPPNAPTTLAGGSTTISIGVSAVATATSYIYQRSETSATTGFVTVATLPGLRFDDTGLTAGTTYWYRYAAANADGQSPGWSPVLQQATGSVGTRPATPTSPPAASLVDSNSATLTMPAVTDATTYILQRSTTGSGAAHTKLGTWPTAALPGGDTLDDVSGLVTSRRHPGVIWTHNSNNPEHLIFGVEETGGSTTNQITHRATLHMVGNGFTITEDSELEDCAYSIPDNSVWVANSGGNVNQFTAYKFPEPTTLTGGGTGGGNAFVGDPGDGNIRIGWFTEGSYTERRGSHLTKLKGINVPGGLNGSADRNPAYYREFGSMGQNKFGSHASPSEMRRAIMDGEVPLISYDVTPGNVDTFLSGGNDGWIDNLANDLGDIWTRYRMGVHICLANEPDAFDEGWANHPAKLKQLRDAARKLNFDLLGKGVTNFEITNPTTIQWTWYASDDRGARAEVDGSGSAANVRWDCWWHYHPDWKGTRSAQWNRAAVQANGNAAWNPDPDDFYQGSEKCLRHNVVAVNAYCWDAMGNADEYNPQGAGNMYDWVSNPVLHPKGNLTYEAHQFDNDRGTSGASSHSWQTVVACDNLYGVNNYHIVVGELGWCIYEQDNRPGQDTRPVTTVNHWGGGFFDSLIRSNVKLAAVWKQVHTDSDADVFSSAQAFGSRLSPYFQTLAHKGERDDNDCRWKGVAAMMDRAENLGPVTGDTSTPDVTDVSATRYKFQWGSTGETYNCEAMMCAPNGRLYFIPKHDGTGSGTSAAATGLWQAPATLAAWPTVNVLTKVATIGDTSTPPFIIGAADWAPDGSFFSVVKTATAVDVTTSPTVTTKKFRTSSPWDSLGTFEMAVASRVPLSGGRSQEGGCFRADSSGFLVTSQGAGTELWGTDFTAVTWSERYRGTNRVWSDTGLTALTNYDYRYRVGNAAGESIGWSPVARVTTSSASTGNVTPVSALYVRERSGICTHPQFAGVWDEANAPEIFQKIAGLGVTFIRGQFSDFQATNDLWRDLCVANNVKWLMVALPAVHGAQGEIDISSQTIAQTRTKIRNIRDNYANVCYGIEGANEPNDNREAGFGIPPDWADQTVAYQNAIWEECKTPLAGGAQNPLFNVSIVGPSLHSGNTDASGGEDWNKLEAAGLIVANGPGQNCNFIGMHSYPSGKFPTRRMDHGTTQANAGRLEYIFNTFGAGTPVWTSEWGYHSAMSFAGSPGVDRATGGVYGPRGFLQIVTTVKRNTGDIGVSGDMWPRNNMHCTYYELLDDVDGFATEQLSTDKPSRCGLVAVGTNDPATWTNKTIYTTVAALLNALKDPLGTAPYTTTQVTCTVSSADPSPRLQWQVTQTKAQSLAGTATCWIWRDMEVWKEGTQTNPIGTTIVVPAISTTVVDRVGARSFSVNASVQRIDLR